MNGAMTHFCAKKVEGIANHKCRYYNGDRDTNNSICHNVTFIFLVAKVRHAASSTSVSTIFLSISAIVKTDS
jgi:hypothetical protein